METIIVRRGETLELTINSDDDTAQTVTLKVVQDGVTFMEETENFVEGVAVIQTNDTLIPLGTYEYTLKVLYSDGFIEILPSPDDCGDDCVLPSLVVCESLEDIVS